MSTKRYLIASKPTCAAKWLYQRLIDSSTSNTDQYANCQFSWVETREELNQMINQPLTNTPPQPNSPPQPNIPQQPNTPPQPNTPQQPNTPPFEYIFFFHWSWIVPKDIWEHQNCVVIHTSNLPYGRGGSPLQNQIMDEIYQTRVNALKMVSEVDAGPIYTSRTISLQGSIDDIWFSIARAAFEIISQMITTPLIPTPQINPNLHEAPFQPHYRRRKDNILPLDPNPDHNTNTNTNSNTNSNSEKPDLRHLYDFIRMLDGETYPKAYIELGPYHLEFSRAQLSQDQNQDQYLLADVKIKLRN